MAAKNMLSYTVEGPQKDRRPVGERTEDSRERYTNVSLKILTGNATRCGDCGTHPCNSGWDETRSGCPLGNRIQVINALAAAGDFRKAYEISIPTSPMGAVTGRVCPADQSLCQSACVLSDSAIGSGHGSVQIAAIEAKVHDLARKHGWAEPPTPLTELNKSVGIIGSGPGGYTAADALRRMGYQVTIYERAEKPGGLNTFGIPDFKLRKDIVDHYYDLLQRGGVKIECNTDIGSTIGFEQLATEHDALIVATGKTRPKDARLEGNGKVTEAIDYLRRGNLLASNVSAASLSAYFDPKSHDAVGKVICINGAGDTTSDCIGTAARHGAKEIINFYRGHESRIRANPKDYKDSAAEAKYAAAGEFKLLDGRQVQRVDENPDGSLAISGMRTWFDAKGAEISQEPFSMDADIFVNAIGFEPENLPKMFNTSGLSLTQWGTLDVQDPVRTPHTNLLVAGLAAIFEQSNGAITPVYGVGDIVGSNLVVEAVLGGRDIAPQINEALENPQSLSELYPDLVHKL